MNPIHFILVYRNHLFRPTLGLRAVSRSKMHDFKISALELPEFGLDHLIFLDAIVLHRFNISNCSRTIAIKFRSNWSFFDLVVILLEF